MPRRLPANVPTWAWFAAGGLLIVIAAVLLLPRSQRTRATTAGETVEGLHPDVAAALSGQPHTNAAPVDQLHESVMFDLGIVWDQIDTVGNSLRSLPGHWFS